MLVLTIMWLDQACLTKAVLSTIISNCSRLDAKSETRARGKKKDEFQILEIDRLVNPVKQSAVSSQHLCVAAYTL